jgi:hypothetical protein
MPSSNIPGAVRRLILEAIDSVAELEALLLLRDSPGIRWTAEAASARLYVSPTVAAHTLAVLTRRGLLEETADGYRYKPSSPALAEVVNALATTYASQLIAVTHLIHAKPSPSMQDFARAFRFRKDS